MQKQELLDKKIIVLNDDNKVTSTYFRTPKAFSDQYYIFKYLQMATNAQSKHEMLYLCLEAEYNIILVESSIARHGFQKAETYPKFVFPDQYERHIDPDYEYGKMHSSLKEYDDAWGKAYDKYGKMPSSLKEQYDAWNKAYDKYCAK